MAITTLRLVARITLTRNVLALSRSGGLYCLV
ncbi:aminopeptidase, partial [Escherichia coli]